MEYQRFTANGPGQLRKFHNPVSNKGDWLFIPNEMPPNWEFAGRLWPLLVEAVETLGTLNGIGRTLPNSDLLLHPLQNREAITSSSIEGTYVTPEQLLMYELDPRDPVSAEGEVADWREVLNYRDALRHGCSLIKRHAITNGAIRSMHKRLMTGVRGHRKAPGNFRTIQVQIGSTGKYVPPPPTEIPRLMGDLEKYLNTGDERYHPLVLSYIIHYQIEAIHPFADGNGRIGRVLLALMIYKLLGHSMPWLYMSAFFEKYKDEYTGNLFRVSTEGDWESWIEYCLNGTVQQARDAITRCDKIAQLRDSYHKRIDTTATPRSHMIVEKLFETPFLTIPVTAALCDITYQTARKDIQLLADAGVLFELGDSRPRSFYAKELFRIAYGNAEEETEEDD